MKNLRAGIFNGFGLKVRCLALLPALALFISVIPAIGANAGTKIAFNEEEYNIYVDEYPELVSDNIFAKFTTSVSDPDTYKFTFRSDDVMDDFTKALDKKNIKYKEDYYTAFNIGLFQETEDDDKEVYKSATFMCRFPMMHRNIPIIARSIR